MTQSSENLAGYVSSKWMSLPSVVLEWVKKQGWEAEQSEGGGHQRMLHQAVGVTLRHGLRPLGP